MATPRAPKGLKARGRRLWRQVHAATVLDPAQLLILEEACRMADRLDELDNVIQGRGVLELMQFRTELGSGDGSEEAPIRVEVKFQNVLSEARQQQNVFKQLLVSLRLPDVEGVRPQQRGARGAYDTSTPAAGEAPRKALESALERAKKAAG